MTSPSSGGGASLETEGLLTAPVPVTAKRDTTVRNNKLPRPNLVTRRATVEPMGAVTRYRVVRPNNSNNSNNHAALVERFQPSTLHELRQLGLYNKTDTPDIAHQLYAEAVATEVAYTMTNTQPSCSERGE